MSAKQKGFGAIELILVFVAIGIVGFAGWFVWNGQKQLSKTLDDSGKGSSAVVATEKTATASTGTVTATTNKTDASTYLTIKEWGIKVPMPAGDNSYTYTIQDSADVWITNQQLNQALTDAAKTAGGTCGISGIQVFRATKSSVTNNDPRKYSAEIKGYMYGLTQGTIGGPALAPCVNDANLNNAIAQTEAALAGVWDKVAAQ